jgi:cytochrome c biogenesis protein CcmG/thiol:disulfide interchange protein DsbE
MRPLLIALAVTIPIVGVLAFGLTRDPRAIPSPLIGRPAPTFVFRLFDGGVLDTKTLGGKVLVVNFWASWCYPACYEEAPRLQRVWERYKACGVFVIGVNIQDREAAARQFIRRFGQTFPDGMDRTGEISIDFGVYGVPETFIVGQDGLIVAKYVGAVPEEWLIDHIQRRLDSGTALSGRSCSS